MPGWSGSSWTVRDAAADGPAPITHGSIFRRFWKPISGTFALLTVENILSVAEPALFGLAINRLVAQDWTGLAWLAALESQMAEHGVAVAAARREALGRIEAGMALATGPFPRARLAAQGVIEAWLADMPALAAEEKYRAVLAERRGIDREAGAATEGPHRSDTAALCSTGEQKALLIAITLANARLIRARRQMAPLMLLDEISAHLDARRRAALYDELLALGGQVWLTGTDDDLFAGLAGQAEFFTVADGVVTPRAAFS